MKPSISFRIELSGIVQFEWSEYFENITASFPDGKTLLTGTVIDQAGLHAIIARIRDLNLVIVSVKIENSQ